MSDCDFSILDRSTSVVVVHVDVPSLLAEFWLGCKCDGPNIVRTDKYRNVILVVFR